LSDTTATREQSNDQVVELRVGEVPSRSSVIRAHTFLVGIVLLLLNSFWIIQIEKVHRGPFPTIISLFANVIFTLAVLTGCNALWKRIYRPIAFSTSELLVIYTMVAIGSSLAGHDMVPNLVGTMVHPYHFATPENNWAGTFLSHLPSWLTVSNKDVVEPLYKGGDTLYRHSILSAWVKPVMWWTLFITVMIWVMMCINTLVRKQWTDRERLTFPIIQLPLAMTEPTGAIWRNRLFWLGFGIAFSIDLLNGLALYFPYVPTINVGFQDLASGLTAKPWNALGWTPYSFYPFVIGLGYLLPADLSFSCWFFYWFWKAQLVVSSALALDAVPEFPYIRHQCFGGYIAIILMLLWTSRGYLRQLWLRVKGEPSELDDSTEPISYRTALVGAFVGFLFLCWFLGSLGVSPWVAVTAFVIYFLLSTAIARMRAELGPPVHDLHFSGPDFIITRSVGLDRLSNGSLVGLSMMYWFNRAYRGHPMPIGIEAMKIASVTRASQRKFLWAVMIAAVFGVVGAFWADLHYGYKLGFASKFAFGDGFAGEAYRNLDGWWRRPRELAGPNWGMNVATLSGFLFCVFLGYMRLNVFSWPFHPIGFAISGSWSMNLVWLPIMLAWLIKISILRFGGLKTYKNALPFFLGLILGEMMIGSIWSLFAFTDIPYFSFWGA
jgi:hypothetical protein